MQRTKQLLKYICTEWVLWVGAIKEKIIYIYLYTLQFKEKAHITNPRNGLCESGLYRVWLFWNINTELSQTNKLYVPAEENDTRNKTKPITNEIPNSLMRDIPLVKKR